MHAAGLWLLILIKETLIKAPTAERLARVIKQTFSILDSRVCRRLLFTVNYSQATFRSAG